MIKLFVENQEVDVNVSFSTLITYAIDDIKDFGAKNTSFSKTIIVPGTKRNNVLFGNIFNINSANDYTSVSDNIGINFNAAQSASAIIFADNLQVFKGIFRILEIVIEDGFIEFECCVIGELGGFVSALGNKKLEELNMGISNQTYNETTISTSWDTIAGSGVYYPLIDYGQSSTLKVDFDFKTFRPALYVKQYLTKLVEASGYTWDFPLLATALFDRLIIPNNAQKLYTNNSTAFVAAPTSYNYTSADNVKMTISQTGSFTANGTNDQFTYGGAAINTNVVLYVAGQINTIDPVLNTFTLNFIKNSTIISTASVNVTSTPFAFSLTLDVSNLNIATSDVLYVDAVGNIGDYDVTGGLFEIMLTTPGQVEVGYGDTIVLNDTIPKGILQKDFFSSICKMFNLYVFEDYNFEKKLKVIPFITYYEDALSVDWSLKVDRAKPMKIKPMSELNSRYYQYKYKSDNDYYNDNYRKKFNEEYGSYIYDSEYEFAKETTSIDIIFASSVQYSKTGTDKYFPAIYKLSNENTKEDKMDSVIRILQAQKISSVTSWALKNGGTTLASYTAYGYCGHLNHPTSPTSDINFGIPKELYYDASVYTQVNLFNAYWSSYLAEITDKDSRLLTCTMKLSYKDIYQLDFSKLIWIDGVLYRLNRIVDYNATNEDTCSVELLKIINRIY
jgi:hypothetical protein